MARGGARTPARPAAVSGPGRFSQRTDGGPSQGTAQMAAAGGAYGERAAIEAQAASAPVPTGGAGKLAPRGASPSASPGAGGVFGPTARPQEPITAGAGPYAGPTGQFAGQDEDMILEILYKNWPSPLIAGLMNR